MKMKLTTNMKGLQKFHELHPHKSLKGYFTLDGRELTHREVLTIVNYAVEHGYETEADIPEEELNTIFKND